MASDSQARRLAQRRIVDALTRHGSYLHRASSAQVSAITELIDELSGQMLSDVGERLDNLAPAELRAFSQGRYTTDRLKGMRKTIDGWAATMAERIDTMAKEGLEELAEHEAQFTRRLLTESIEDSLPAAPAGAAVYAAAMQQPMMGQLVEDALANIPERTRQQVYSRMRQGITSGEANGAIIRALRGTKALGYKDGVLNWPRRQIDTVVRTARNHASGVAYEETYAALGVEELVWIARLEGRVCMGCAALDGQRFKVGSNHPRNPLHYNCACQLAPSLDGNVMGERPYVRALKVRNGYTINEDGDRVRRAPHFRGIGDMTKKQRKDAGLDVGQVSASTTYPDWFKNQSAAYQKDWLGPARYKLYKDGGYQIDRFVDPLGQKLTIEQLRQRDAKTFAELFG